MVLHAIQLKLGITDAVAGSTHDSPETTLVLQVV